MPELRGYVTVHEFGVSSTIMEPPRPWARCFSCNTVAKKLVDDLCIRCYHQPTHRGLQAVV